MSESNPKIKFALTAAVEALTIAEKRYQALVDAMLDPWIRIDRDGTVLDFQGLEQLSFREDLFEKALGKGAPDQIYPASLLKNIRQMIYSAIDEEIVQNAEITLPVNNKERTYQLRIARSGADEALIIIRETSSLQQVNENLLMAEVNLAESAQELEQRRTAMSLLAEMGRAFQSAGSLENLFPLVSVWGSRLFPDARGDLLLAMPPESKDKPLQYKSITSWGQAPAGINDLLPLNCPALKEGAAVSARGSQCQSLYDQEIPLEFLEAPHLCTPIIAEGRIYALLRLLWLNAHRLDKPEYHRQMAALFTEQVGLSINNILLTSVLREQTLYDPLTQVYNRRYLLDALRRELYRANREGYQVAVLLLELDNLNAVVEKHGREAGDALLKEIAALLKKTVRASDIICRASVNGFALALSAVPERVAALRGEEIRLAAQNLRLTVHEKTISDTISCGIAIFPLHASHLDDLLEKAAAALKQARKQGGNQVIFAEIR